MVCGDTECLTHILVKVTLSSVRNWDDYYYLLNSVYNWIWILLIWKSPQWVHSIEIRLLVLIKTNMYSLDIFMKCFLKIDMLI